MRMQVPSLASLSELRIWHCCELQHRLQMQLRSSVTMALARAGSYSSNSTPSLGISICHRCGLKKRKKNSGDDGQFPGQPQGVNSADIEKSQNREVTEVFSDSLSPAPKTQHWGFCKQVGWILRLVACQRRRLNMVYLLLIYVTALERITSISQFLLE